MLIPLLNTKVTIPPFQENIVLRARLHERLNKFIRGSAPLLLISAKAGAGKSSMVSQWLQHSNRKAAWLSLDANDNDPERFTRYMVAALHEAGMMENLELSAAFDGLTSPDPVALAALFLERSSLADIEPLLVLDDYHMIENEWVHTFIESIIRGFSPIGRLILITRTDPPMPLALWRGRSQMAEIRDIDLRFHPAEIDQYMKGVMQLDLSSSQVSLLDGRTEGWIVGLQMAAITMRTRAQTGRLDEFIRSFGGTNRYILDYLIDEVLGQQPAAIQEFLLETSILDRFSPGACDAVWSRVDTQLTGVEIKSGGTESTRPASYEILRQLEQSNMFLVPLDDERQWFRYHHLFADLLRNELYQRRSQEELSQLHERASHWFRENQFIEEAMTHALAAHDYDVAGAIIEENIVSMLSQSTMPQLLRWIGELPEEVVRARPWIAVYWANTLAFAGKVEGVEDILAGVEGSSAGEPDEHALKGYVAAIRAYLANLQGDAERTFKMAAVSQEYLSDVHINACAMASYALADAHFAMDNMPQAETAFENLLRIGEKSGQLMMTVSALCELASVRKVQGNLQAAQGLYSQAWEQLAEHNGLNTRLRCHYEFGMADLLYEWNRLDEAYEHASAGMDVRERLGGYYVTGDIPLMRILQARGEPKAALAVLRDVEQVLSTAHVQLSGLLALRAASVIESLAVGDLESASTYAEKCVGGTDLEVLARARLLLVMERFKGVLDLVTPHVQSAQKAGRTARAIGLLCLQALAHDGLGEQDKTSDALMEAVSLGREASFIRTFLDIDPRLAKLLHRSIEPNWTQRPDASHMDLLMMEYADTLLTAFAQERDARENELTAMIRRSQPEGYADPLTERELEVLALLAQGHTNKELASHLIVAPSTIKQHLKNIYAKLGVHTRTEAVARARELNLLI